MSEHIHDERRVKACLRACDGISTETLENTQLSCCDVAAHQVNTELIEALKRQWCPACEQRLELPRDYPELECICDVDRAVLAKHSKVTP